jgi:hypothetical protein
MKLQRKDWTSKAGKQGTTYTIGKLNEMGEGIEANKTIKGVFVFEPQIRNIQKNDGSGSFQVINAIMKWDNLSEFNPENVELDQYGSLNVKLPSGLAKYLNGQQWKGIPFNLTLVPFKTQDGQARTAWNLERQDGQAFKPQTPEFKPDYGFFMEKYYDAKKQKIDAEGLDINDALRAWFGYAHQDEYKQMEAKFKSHDFS